MNMIKNFSDEIKVGQWIYQSLYSKGLGVIYSIDGNVNKGEIVEQKQNVLVSFSGGYLNVVFLDGSVANHAECLLRGGVQYGFVDKAPATQDEIDALLLKAQQKEIDDEAEKLRNAFAFENQVEEHRNNPENAHLIQLNDKHSSMTDVAKNVRLDLKKHFKGVKFSVRCHRCSIVVNWTDGATEKQVKKVVDRYHSAHFNGMEDIQEQNYTAFHSVFGSVDYMRYNRECSETSIKAVIASLCEEKQEARELSYQAFSKGEYHNEYFESCAHDSIQRLIRNQWAETDYSPKAKSATKTAVTPPAPIESDAELNGVKTFNHTETGKTLYVVTIAKKVARDTFLELCKQAKALGGYYSRYNKDGAIAGFIFKTPEAASEFKI
ncbi:LPD29 domain-containing protein [Vibrio anguillarum]|uniref:Large polyvalent protein associated domain-containing protein n=1 Tax=Vibrio anguillarum TaxID=55601 RepID=A0A7U6FS80_VIBAN|nr:LPD29 domain-containing protein [Vibrio anguillarum]AZS26280.1 hypothetical protein DYL72_15335 [Vibrio anguillarum]MBF4374561.1 hypothetical protein [Vibrio anguillarum]MBF4437342.1 hypothetical protein [Vibrio anguillarum]